MKISWKNPDRYLSSYTTALFEKQAQSLSFLKRMDIVLVSGLVISLTLLAVFWFLFVEIGNRYGIFNPPILSQIKDERILQNIREQIAAQPLLDAVYHLPDKRVYVTQQGGWLHSYDPATNLWDSQQLNLPAELKNRDFINLRSGCGTDPLSTEIEKCADPDTLWAISESAGLIWRKRGRWDLLVGDTAFVGARGKPVESEDLVSAAISDDQNWLVVGTREDGPGVYNLRLHSWLNLSPEIYAKLPTQHIQRVQWWGDLFWLGTDEGLYTLKVGVNKYELKEVLGKQYKVLDLDADSEQGLWILAHQPCETGGTNCLWLGRTEGKNTNPQAWINERNLYLELGLSTLIFAQQWDNQLVVAGEGGIYAYDLSTHQWNRVFDKDIDTVLALRNRKGFYFAYQGGVGLIRNTDFSSLITGGSLQTWPVPETPIHKLQFGEGDNVIALTSRGNVYTLSPAGNVLPAYVGSETGLNPNSFTNAIPFAKGVVLLGPQGGLIHNVVQRSYIDIPNSLLPEWLKRPDNQIVESGGEIFILSEGNAVYNISALEISSTAFYTSTDIQKVSPVLAASPLSSVWAWDTQGMGGLAMDGSVYRFASQGSDRLTGAPLPELNTANFLDAAGLGSDLFLATNESVYHYQATFRSLEKIQPPPVDQRAIELAGLAQEVFGVTNGASLVSLANSREILIGGEKNLKIQDKELSDVTLHNNSLYLGGAGWVEKYDPERRTITDQWDLPGDGTVSLLGFVQDLPLSFINGTVVWGDNPLDTQSGIVSSASLDANNIWTVRQKDGRQFIKGYPLQSPLQGKPVCFFRQPSTPTSSQVVFDARALANGTVVSILDSGIHFYSPAARSWYLPPSDLGLAAQRVYLLQDYLILAEAITEDFRIAIIPLQSIALPDSCSNERVQLNAQVVRVRAYAIDEAANRLAWLNSDGSVQEWVNDQAVTRLAANSTAPAQESLRRVYDRGETLLFTTDNAIWRYHLINRQWSSIRLDLESPNNIQDINLERYDNKEVVLARTIDGKAYLGELGDGDASVKLTPIYAPGMTSFGAPGDAILDVQERENIWYFLLTDRLKRYDPTSRRWGSDVVFDETNDASRQLMKAAGLNIVLADNENLWWIESRASNTSVYIPYRVQPGEMTALDNGGQVWRLTVDGQVLLCTVKDQAGYQCYLQFTVPFLLEKDDVRQAFSWQEMVFFDTITRGLLIYDTAQKKAIETSEEVGSLNGVLSAHSTQDRLWLQYPGQVVIFDKVASTGSLNVRSYSPLLRLVSDNQGRPWALFSNGWQVWRDNQFVNPNLTSDMRLFIYNGAIPTAVDKSGFSYHWDGQDFVRDSLPLPGEVVSNLSALVLGINNEWWALNNGQMFHIVWQVCATPTIAPTATARATTTPGATPVPGSSTPTTVVGQSTPPATTPVPIQNCWVAKRTGVDLPDVLKDGTQILWAKTANDQVELGGEPGTGRRIEWLSAGTYKASSISTVPAVAGEIKNEWSSLQNNLGLLPNGKSAYNPITKMAVVGGELVASGPGRSHTLAKVVASRSEFEQPPALDYSWLRWDRSQQGFQVTTSRGWQFISKRDFEHEGRLLFEPVEAILAEAPNRIHLANQHGVWTFSQADFSLLNSNILYQPAVFSLPIMAAHGRFMDPVHDWAPNNQQTQNAQNHIAINFQDVTVTEQTRNREVSISVKVGTEQVNAFTPSGLIWDTNRRGLAFKGSELLLQTNAGINRLNELANFDPGPGQVAQTSAQLANEGGQVYLRNGESWYVTSSSGWAPVSVNPALNRSLLNTNQWVWDMVAGQIHVQLKGQPHSFAVRTGSQGIYFSSDELLAAATYENKLYVATTAFLEVANQPQELGTLTAERLAPLQTDQFLSFPFADGRRELFSFSQNIPARWNQANRRFENISSASDPRLERSLINGARLRFTLKNGQVVKDVRLTSFQGKDEWVRFDFTNRRFPFDQVTSVASFNNQLYVGTAAGLQVFSDPFNHSLTASPIYDLRGNNLLLSSVLEVGTPYSDPDILMAASTDTCFQFDGSGWTDCVDKNALKLRLRLRNDFWEWVLGSNGQVAGYHLDFQGKPSALPMKITNGRLPHDDIKDVTVCAGSAATLWQSSWISISPNTELMLQNGIRNYPVPDLNPQRFYCATKDIPLPAGTLAAGLYLQGSQNQQPAYWQYNVSGWTPVNDPALQNELVWRTVSPPAYEQDRIRLRKPNASQDENIAWQFEQRDLANEWQIIEWNNRRLAVDHWREVLYKDGTLWAATPAGIVPYTLPSDRTIEMDPAAVIVIREPVVKEKMCEITDLEIVKDQVMLRCEADSKQIFQGSLNGNQDRNVFKSFQGADPFAEKELIDEAESTYWKWRLLGRSGGSPGFLQVRLQNEEVQLTGGRFSFDRMNSLAIYTPGKLDFTTDAAGWYQTNRDDLNISNLARPNEWPGIDPVSFNRVSITDVDGQAALCLREPAGRFTRLQIGEAPEGLERCNAYVGRDSLWHYEVGETGLSISAGKQSQGVSERVLMQGRFVDDLLIGLPITGQDETGIYYLIPTQAGVVRMTDELVRTFIYATPFEGATEPPRALFMNDQSQPIYATHAGFFHLEGSQEKLPVNLDLPKDAQLVALEAGPEEMLRLRWKKAGQPGWQLIERSSLHTSPANTQLIDFSRFESYVEHRSRLGDEKSMVVRWGVDHFEFSMGEHEPLTLDLPRGFDLIQPILWRERLLLLGRQDLQEIDLAQVMLNAASQPLHAAPDITLAQVSAIPTPEPSSTSKPLPTATKVATITATLPPPETPTFTATWTPSSTPTSTPSPSPTPTQTATPGSVSEIWQVGRDRIVERASEQHSGTGRRKNVRRLTFNSDGSLLASVCWDTSVMVWETPLLNPRYQWDLRDDARIYDVAFNPDGQYLASAHENKVVRLWNIQTGKLENIVGYKGDAYSVAFSANGSLLAVGSLDKNVYLVQLSNRRIIRTISIGHLIYSVDFSPVDQLLAIGGAGGLYIMDPNNPSLSQPFSGISKNVGLETVEFSPNGELLAASVGREVRVWNVDNKQLEGTFIHSNNVSNFAFSPDGSMLVTVSDTLTLWDVKSQQQIGNIDQAGVISVAFSPDGWSIATGSNNGRVTIWTVR